MRAVLALVAAMIASVPAQAAPVGVVVVAEEHAPLAPGRVRDAVAAAIRSSGATAEAWPGVAAAARLEAGAAPRARRATLERAASRARDGWNAYLAAELEQARTLLHDARALAESALDAGGTELLADISLRLGAVLVQLGRDAEATAALALARALDPGRAVSIEEFAPEVVHAYEAAAQAAGSTAVEIMVAPAGAAVAMDGRDVGAAPVHASVAPGPHAIVARAPGHHGRALIVDVAARPEAQRIDIVLEPDPVARAVLDGRDTVARGASLTDTAALVEGMLEYAELGSLVLVASAWRGGAPALLGQRCAGVPARCTAVVEVRYRDARDMDAAAAELWASAQAEPLAAGPELVTDARLDEGPPRSPAPAAPACGWCRSPWLWIGVGAGVLAAGTAVWMTRGSASRPVVIVDPCGFGGCR